MACSVLQEMANSVYLVMEVSSHGARASTGPSRMGIGGYKHALLIFLAGILGINTCSGQVQEIGMENRV